MFIVFLDCELASIGNCSNNDKLFDRYIPTKYSSKLTKEQLAPLRQKILADLKLKKIALVSIPKRDWKTSIKQVARSLCVINELNEVLEQIKHPTEKPHEELEKILTRYQKKLKPRNLNQNAYLKVGELLFEAAHLDWEDKDKAKELLENAKGAFSMGFDLAEGKEPRQYNESTLMFALTLFYFKENTKAFELFKKAARKIQYRKWTAEAHVAFG